MRPERGDPFPAQATQRVTVSRRRRGRVDRNQDLVAVEEPLEIRVTTENAGQRQGHSVAVTMRTPGDDPALAAGFLFSEGVVSQATDIWRIEHCREVDREAEGNMIDVHLAPAVEFDSDKLSRRVLTSSACGLCGRTSIEAVQRVCSERPRGNLQLDLETLGGLTALLESKQAVFTRTGGLHAAALFDRRGELLDLREDVGRHNALDKLIGRLLLANELPASRCLVLVSGRLSFELVQKSVLAGVPILAAVGAPSSLAIDLAREYGMTLIGFLSQERCNIYSGDERIIDP